MTYPQPLQPPPPNWGRFSTREWEILILLTYDLGSAQIVDRLCVSKGRLYNLKNEIADKLEVQGRDAVNRYARQHRTELHYWYPYLCKCPNPGLLDPPQ